MPQRRREPDEIVAKLRQVDVLLSQGRPVVEAIRTINVTPFTCPRWRKEFGGLKSDQVKRLKDLEKERAIGTPLMGWAAPVLRGSTAISTGRRRPGQSGRRAF